MAEYISAEGSEGRLGGADTGEPISTALPDHEGLLPGDPHYNATGAQVRYREAKFGLRFEYHTKRGIRPILTQSGETVLTDNAETSGRQVQRREQFIADLTKGQQAIADLKD